MFIDKYICLFFIMMSFSASSFSKSLLDDNVTQFDCRKSDSEATNNAGYLSGALRYDGIIKKIIPPQAIYDARLSRVLLSNLDVLCNATFMTSPEVYSSNITKAMPINVKYVHSVYFANGSASAMDRNIIDLDKLLSSSPEKHHGILIVGSADSPGEKRGNHLLSLERAYFLAGLVESNKRPLFILPLGSTAVGRSGKGTSQPQYRRADLYVLQYIER